MYTQKTYHTLCCACTLCLTFAIYIIMVTVEWSNIETMLTIHTNKSSGSFLWRQRESHTCGRACETRTPKQWCACAFMFMFTIYSLFLRRYNRVKEHRTKTQRMNAKKKSKKKHENRIYGKVKSDKQYKSNERLVCLYSGEEGWNEYGNKLSVCFCFSILIESFSNTLIFLHGSVT